MPRWQERARGLAAQVLVYGAVPGVLASAVAVRPPAQPRVILDQGRSSRMDEPEHARRCLMCRQAREERRHRRRAEIPPRSPGGTLAASPRLGPGPAARESSWKDERRAALSGMLASPGPAPRLAATTAYDQVESHADEALSLAGEPDRPPAGRPLRPRDGGRRPGR